jgi:hypothetical protein
MFLMARAMVDNRTDVNIIGGERYEPNGDPFFSEANMSRLRQAVADMKNGVNISVHELIEAEDD